MKKIILYSLGLALLISCQKDKDGPANLPGDAQAVRLKDFTIPALPSPMYFLEYDNEGLITRADHSSGEWSYVVGYKEKRIDYMRNVSPINKDSFSYHYSNGRVDLITVYNLAGEQYRRCFIDYDNRGRLENMEWERKSGPGFAADINISFSYHADNNLRQRIYRRTGLQPGPGAAELIDTYSDYDSRPCGTGFTLLHEPSNPMVLLPASTLSLNNPRKLVRTGTGQHYEIVYSYQYNAQKLPIERNGVMTYLTGPEAGNSFNLKAFFSYY